MSGENKNLKLNGVVNRIEANTGRHGGPAMMTAEIVFITDHSFSEIFDFVASKKPVEVEFRSDELGRQSLTAEFRVVMRGDGRL